MISCNEAFEFKSEILTTVITFLSVLVTAELDVQDKLFFSRLLIFIGQSITFEATLELREQEQLAAAQQQVAALNTQIQTLNGQMEAITRKMRN